MAINEALIPFFDDLLLMDSTYLLGLFLVGLSAVMLAAHWQQWREPECRQEKNPRWQDYAIRKMRRRVVASSLVGIIGFTLMAFETVPRTPLSITAYLFSLVLMTCWILWLAFRDMLASRRFYEEQQLDQLAEKFRHVELESSRLDSNKS